MRLKGINYDIGTYFVSGTVSSRPVFDQDLLRREIEIIANDLQCNAIRISGRDLDRLTFAAERALEAGLEVWFSPALIDADEETLLSYVAECADAAETLRQESPKVVFVAACELTIFMQGLIDGATFLERIGRLSDRNFRMSGGARMFNSRLNAFLVKAAAAIRKRFEGPITYASGTWEQVDWTLFDAISVDQYRDKSNRDDYGVKLRAHSRFGKPVVVTEFGCCTYAGADEKGGMGWAIVDWSTSPPQLDGDYVRDEGAQARLIVELLSVFDAEKIDGAFLFTFVAPLGRYNGENPRLDLDLASYSVVKTLAQGNGATYPDMPWEPKESFHAVAAYYGTPPPAG